MIHSRNLNNKMHSIHARALRIAHNDTSSSFQNLVDKDTYVTIHHRNIRTLVTETYKVLSKALHTRAFSPPLLNEVFVERDRNYNLRRKNFLKDNFSKIWY